jgi:hypothetical protein
LDSSYDCEGLDYNQDAALVPTIAADLQGFAGQFAGEYIGNIVGVSNFCVGEL